MIIGIDASKATVSERTGIENLTYQLILNLSIIDKFNTYHLYTPLPLDKEILKQNNFVQKLSPGVRFWNKTRLPLELLKDKPDVFIEPGYVLPPFSPKNSIVVIHDLAFKHFPDSYSKKDLLLQEYAARRAAKKAGVIIMPSESTKKDFLQYHRVSKDKLVVIPLGYDENRFGNIGKPENILKIDSPYVLFVGRLEKRKNVLRIIKAFSLFKNKTRLPYRLVLAGKSGNQQKGIDSYLKEHLPLKDEIIMPGYVNDRDIPDLYAGASLFVFPSLYEGFGIPILEAFASGIPVLTSNTSSLAEVAGNAAYLVNPLNENEIANGMTTILTNSNVRDELVKLGYNQAQKYSWLAFAREVYNQIEAISG